MSPRMLGGQFPSVRVIQPSEAPFCFFFGHIRALLRIWMGRLKGGKQKYKKATLLFLNSSYGDI